MTPNGKIAAVLAVTILAISGTVIAFAVTDPDRDVNVPFISENNAPKYSITYVLDGGTNPDDAPNSYTSADKPELPIPTKEGYVFTGWTLTDGEVILNIPNKTKGNITLYATWEESSVGKRVTYEHYSNYYTTQYNSVPSIVSFDYLHYEWPRGYLMCMSIDGDKNDIYWTSENDDTVWENTGTKPIVTKYYGTKTCEIWSSPISNGSERQYVDMDNGEVYRIDLTQIVNYVEYVTDRFELKETGECPVVEVLHDNENQFTDSITMYSKNIPLHLDTILTDLNWWAKSNVDEDSTTGTGQTATVSRVGTFKMHYIGTDSEGRLTYGSYTEMVDGYYSFTWSYNSTQYTITTDIDVSDYLRYKEDTTQRSDTGKDHILKFITYNDPTIKTLASNLSTLCAGKSENETANIVLAYVQSIPYQYDSDFNGQDEYWKYALETVFDGSGDCEDTSILYCALMKAMGYDTAIAIAYAEPEPTDSYSVLSKWFHIIKKTSQHYSHAANHCVSYVKVDELSPLNDDSYVVIDGTTYYFCETTSSGFDIGENPWYIFELKSKYKVV